MAQQPPAYTPSAQGSTRSLAQSEEDNPFKDPVEPAHVNENENPFKDVERGPVKYA